MIAKLRSMAPTLLLTEFSEKANWQSFRLPELGPQIHGYTESYFDGRFVYFGPERTEEGAHCRMLRFDTHRPFSWKISWDWFDASDVVGRPASYVGMADDGRYIYFAPFRGGQGLNVEINQVALRYDRRKKFTDPRSWTAFDLSKIHPELGGFVGATCVDGCVYFTPYYSGSRSLFLKYRSDLPFDNAASWATFDTMDVDIRAKGYLGVESDGRYLYFGPCFNDTLDHTNTIMLRYDTRSEFKAAKSWELYDLAAAKENPFLGGYHGSLAFDGRHIYYTPLYAPPKPADISTMHHGWLARFDTQSVFANAASWQTFNTRTLRPDVCGYSGAGFDGRYVYYNPQRCCSHSIHGKVLRYDTCKEFENPAAYEIFDAQSKDKGLAYFDGLIAFDGVHVYFSAPGPAGMMMRFRTRSRLAALLLTIGVNPNAIDTWIKE